MRCLLGEVIGGRAVQPVCRDARRETSRACAVASPRLYGQLAMADRTARLGLRSPSSEQRLSGDRFVRVDRRHRLARRRPATRRRRRQSDDVPAAARRDHDRSCTRLRRGSHARCPLAAPRPPSSSTGDDRRGSRLAQRHAAARRDARAWARGAARGRRDVPDRTPALPRRAYAQGDLAVRVRSCRVATCRRSHRGRRRALRARSRREPDQYSDSRRDRRGERGPRADDPRSVEASRSVRAGQLRGDGARR